MEGLLIGIGIALIVLSIIGKLFGLALKIMLVGIILGVLVGAASLFFIL